MLVLAELNGQDWSIIIGAINMGVAQILTMVFNFLNARQIKRQNAEVATVVKQATTAVTGLQEVTGVQNQKLDDVKTTISQVEKQTNGMTERLVQSTKDGAYAQGQLDGRARAKSDATSDSTIRLLAATMAKPPVAQPITEPDMEQVHSE